MVCINESNLVFALKIGRLQVQFPLGDQSGLEIQPHQEAPDEPRVKTAANGSDQHRVSDAVLSKLLKIDLEPTK